MAFMQKQVEHMECWQVETTCGTECVPSNLVGLNINVDSLSQYTEGEIHCDANGEFNGELVTGWFARLSAPGYMDCTAWSGPFKSEKEAMDYLCELYDAEDAD